MLLPGKSKCPRINLAQPKAVGLRYPGQMRSGWRLLNWSPTDPASFWYRDDFRWWN